MKFGLLLKKELKELITLQNIIVMAFMCGLLIVLGQILGGTFEESFNNTAVTICNLDESEYTKDVLSKLTEKGAEPEYVTLESDDYSAELERLGKDSLVIIPENFGDSIVNSAEPAQVKFVSKVKFGGMGASMNMMTASSAVDSIVSASRDELLLKKYGLTDEEVEKIREPVATVELSTMKGKTAEISAESLSSYIMMLSMVAPMVMFFLLTMASSTIMSAICTEKVDKTLETILSTPVSRISLLTAKMLAALIAGLLNAAFMVVGMIFYMLGMMGGVTDEIAASSVMTDAMSKSMSVPEALKIFGLDLNAGDIILFIISLAVTIATGLTITLILGTMAEDMKSSSNLLTPIMMMTMIPFFITMFVDLSTCDMGLRVIAYVIPFTHSFTALNNLMTDNMPIFWGGLAYQILWLCASMYFALRTFTTDRILTNSTAIKNRKNSKKA